MDRPNKKSGQRIIGIKKLPGWLFIGLALFVILLLIIGRIFFNKNEAEAIHLLNPGGPLGITILLIVLLSGAITAVIAVATFNYRQHLLYQNLFRSQKEQSKILEEIRTTLYSIGDGVITTDNEARVTRMNHVAENLTGWDEVNAKGRPLTQVFQVINEMTRARVENPAERVLNEGVVVGLANHTLLIAQDGSERPIADSGAPIQDKDGEIHGVVLVFRDQSQERAAQKERALIEESLKESEARMVQAQAVAHVGNWEINLKEKTMWGSEEAFRIYGLERSTPYLPMDQVQRIPLAEDRPRLDAQLNNLLIGEGLYDIEYRIRRASDNVERVIHSIAQLVRNEQGISVKVIGTIQDITEITQTTQSLIESELRYRTIFQKNHAVMLWLNPENGTIVDANPAASDFYGWAHEELVRMNINQINTLSTEEIQHDMQIVRREPRKSFTFKHRKKNGQLCDVEVFAGPIQLKGEDFLFSIVHDITDRKKAEVQVAEQLEELQRWYRATLNRETRVLELKHEVNELLLQSGEPPRYNHPQIDGHTP
jgi:PAS domain S-box-containing protein